MKLVLVVLAVAVTCQVLFIISCVQAKRSGDLQQYNRLKWCCLALAVFALGALDYLPKFGIPYYPLGFATTLIFVCLATYAILVHRLLDLTIVIRKSLVYSVLAAIMTAVYFSTVLLAEKLLQGMIGYRSLIGSLIAGFTIALGFNPLKEFVQRIVDQWFFRGSHASLVEENERLRQELLQTEKLKAVATLSAGLAHEIKNPLSSIKTFAEYLPQRYEDPAFREKFSKVVGEEVTKMNRLVQRLLEFARPSRRQLQSLRVRDALQETLDFLQGSLVQRRIQINTRFADVEPVLADPGQLKQAFLNILLNSLEAMDQSGQLVVSTISQNGDVSITIRDTGPGISRKDLPHVFDPFFTTKPHGTGLGLSVVHSIVKEHGGRISIQSRSGEGTSVHISLPRQGGNNGQSAHFDCG